jgi:hypothetical protein
VNVSQTTGWSQENVLPANRPGLVRTGLRTQAVLAGEDDLSTWTDEELVRGQRKDRNGRWSGSQPKVIPYAIVHERNRRQCQKAYDQMRDAVVDAAQYLTAVARGTEQPNRHRLHACEVLFNRVLGKEPQTIQIEETLTLFERSMLEMAGRKPGSWKIDELRIDRGFDGVEGELSTRANKDMSDLDEETLHSHSAIDVEAREAEPVDLEPTEERSGILRRKKTVHRAPDSREDQRRRTR